MFIGIVNASRTAGLATLIGAASIGLAASVSADPDGQMYGNPAAAAPYWRYQHGQDCGLMAVADVVGQVTGREPGRNRHRPTWRVHQKRSPPRPHLPL